MEWINSGYKYSDYSDGHGPELPQGFWFEETPGHGYLCVDKTRWEGIPNELKSTLYSDCGKFEEDCDWCIPIVFHLSLFNLDTQERALRTFKFEFPEYYQKYF